jgi:hypothetical protein
MPPSGPRAQPQFPRDSPAIESLTGGLPKNIRPLRDCLGFHAIQRATNCVPTGIHVIGAYVFAEWVRIGFAERQNPRSSRIARIKNSGAVWSVRSRPMSAMLDRLKREVNLYPCLGPCQATKQFRGASMSSAKLKDTGRKHGARHSLLAFPRLSVIELLIVMLSRMAVRMHMKVTPRPLALWGQQVRRQGPLRKAMAMHSECCEHTVERKLAASHTGRHRQAFRLAGCCCRVQHSRKAYKGHAPTIATGT